MAAYKEAKSRYWWCNFAWHSERIRKSTKQTNKRLAKQTGAPAHRTALAISEVTIREKKPASTLVEAPRAA
jgi:hypothetical protein